MPNKLFSIRRQLPAPPTEFPLPIKQSTLSTPTETKSHCSSATQHKTHQRTRDMVNTVAPRNQCNGPTQEQYYVKPFQLGTLCLHSTGYFPPKRVAKIQKIYHITYGLSRSDNFIFQRKLHHFEGAVDTEFTKDI